MFSLAAMTSITASAKTYGDFEYEVFDNGEADISGYTGKGGKVVIPDTINGNTVTCIDWYAFIGNSNITSITIPDSVTVIGPSAFENCSSLKEIHLSHNLHQIGMLAFTDTAYFQDLSNWENGLLYIGEYLIAGIYHTSVSDEYDNPIILAEAKGDISIKSGTKLIAEYAFSGCDEITSITIPNSVKRIDYDVFGGCKSLNKVTFGTGITKIGGWAFSDCSSLTEIVIPNNVKEIEEFAFIDCNAMKKITVPLGVEQIGDYAFGYYKEYDEETDDWVEKPLSDFHVYCYEGTAAERYAIENGFDYTILTPIHGDVNFDGKVNMLDVLLIRKYIAKQPIALDNNLADVTCDSKVNMLDVLLIRKYIAKQPVTLGPKG